MPYGGTTPDQDTRIESCVIQLTRNGKYDKVSAIRICKASVLQADAQRKAAGGK